MTTILGEHVDMIRPRRIKPGRIYKGEYPRMQYSQESKTVSEHTGKVVSVCIRMKCGGIRGIRNTSKTHQDVIELFNISPEFIDKFGWELDNRNFVWKGGE